MTQKFQISVEITFPPLLSYIQTQNSKLVSHCVDTEGCAFHCLISELQRSLMSALLRSCCPAQLHTHTHPERLEVPCLLLRSLCRNFHLCKTNRIDVTCCCLTDIYVVFSPRMFVFKSISQGASFVLESVLMKFSSEVFVSQSLYPQICCCQFICRAWGRRFQKQRDGLVVCKYSPAFFH